jgi:hypothetical protein
MCRRYPDITLGVLMNDGTQVVNWWLETDGTGYRPNDESRIADAPVNEHEQAEGSLLTENVVLTQRHSRLRWLVVGGCASAFGVTLGKRALSSKNPRRSQS